MPGTPHQASPQNPAWTNDVSAVVAAAAQVARSHGCAAIGPQHLLRALCQATPSEASELLRSIGVDPTRLLDAVPASLTQAPATADSLPFDADAGLVMALAAVTAADACDSVVMEQCVDAGHLLLAIVSFAERSLQHPVGIACRTCHLSADRLVAAIDHRAGPPDSIWVIAGDEPGRALVPLAWVPSLGRARLVMRSVIDAHPDAPYTQLVAQRIHRWDRAESGLPPQAEGVTHLRQPWPVRQRNGHAEPLGVPFCP